MKRNKPKLHKKRLRQAEVVRKAGPHRLQTKKRNSRRDQLRRALDEY